MQQILKSLLLAICFLNSYSVYGSSSEEPGFEARELLSHPQTSTAHNLIINRKPYEQADAMDTIVAEIHRLESTDERIKNAVSNIKSILGTFTGKGDLHSIFLHYNYIINTIGGNAIFFDWTDINTYSNVRNFFIVSLLYLVGPRPLAGIDFNKFI